MKIFKYINLTIFKLYQQCALSEPDVNHHRIFSILMLSTAQAIIIEVPISSFIAYKFCKELRLEIIVPILIAIIYINFKKLNPIEFNEEVDLKLTRRKKYIVHLLSSIFIIISIYLFFEGPKIVGSYLEKCIN